MARPRLPFVVPMSAKTLQFWRDITITRSELARALGEDAAAHDFLCLSRAFENEGVGRHKFHNGSKESIDKIVRFPEKYVSYTADISNIERYK